MTEINNLKKLSNQYYAIGYQFSNSELHNLCIEVSDMYAMMARYYTEIQQIKDKIEKNKESLKKWGIIVNESKDIY